MLYVQLIDLVFLYYVGSSSRQVSILSLKSYNSRFSQGSLEGDIEEDHMFVLSNMVSLLYSLEYACYDDRYRPIHSSMR